MFAYYGDDSGSARRDKIFVVAGYIASCTTWFYDLQVPWERVCKAHPKIDYFKSFECEWLKGQFAGFTEREAEQKRDALVDVVAALTPTDDIIEFGSVMRWEDYDTVVTGKLREQFPNPYFFCIHGVVSLVQRAYLKSIQGPPRLRVAYVLDHQSNLDNEMHRQYEKVRETVKDPMIEKTMGSMSFDDDRVCSPLQVADLIAWHVRRDFVKPERDGGQQRPALKKLRERLKVGEIAFWNPDKLRRFAAAVEAGFDVPNLWT